MRIDAFHLPGLEPRDVARWHERAYDEGRITLRFPVLASGALDRLAQRLRAAWAEHLRDRPVAHIVHAIDRAAARLEDPRDPLRALADDALPAIAGYSPAMTETVLRHAIRDWRAPALDRLLRAELTDPDALDRFVPRTHAPGHARALGPPLAFNVFAGNVPGVAVTAIVRCLLVKAATLGKTAAGEPLLPVLFARALDDVDPAIARCLALTWWPGGDEIEAEALRAADLVIAYGGREAIAALRARVPPGTRFIEHGPRIGLGLIGADALDSTATAEAHARDAARAVALFDQQGCVSPHLLYVERGGAIEPDAFARLLADRLAVLATELPRASLSAAEAAAIHDARAAAEFRAIGGEAGLAIHAPADTAWTVIFDPSPAFEASCLNRLVRVKPLDRLEAVIPLLSPFRDLLQSIAVAASPTRTATLADALAHAGATRITTLSAMPWPPPTWHHDGQGPLRELLKWTDLESA